jgi:hypothetical protein
MTLLPRSLVSWNFLIAIAVGILWFGAQALIGLQELDPVKLRMNRAPFGAAIIIIVEVLLLYLYTRAGELIGLVRTFAGILGIMQLLQGVVIGLIMNLAEGEPFPRPDHYVMWYLAASNLLYALFGEGRNQARSSSA